MKPLSTKEEIKYNNILQLDGISEIPLHKNNLATAEQTLENLTKILT
jgi:hypothetical protein